MVSLIIDFCKCKEMKNTSENAVNEKNNAKFIMNFNTVKDILIETL